MVLNTRRLFVAACLVGFVLLTAKNATDPDLGWHLRTGEHIVSTLSIPHADIFSFTAAGQPWITHEWLAQVTMYLLFRLGGYLALITFFALAASAALLLLYLRCDGQPYLAAFVVLFAAITIAPFWGARPHTVSLLLASAFCYILDRHQREANGRVLLWLVPLTLVWANSHGSFVLGPVLIATYLLGSLGERLVRWEGSVADGRAVKHLAGILVTCVAVIALNPNGLILYAYPFQTLTSRAIQTFIQEWQPPDFSTPAVQPFLWFLIATLGALALSRRHAGLIQLILLVGLTYASLRAARQISLWVFVAAPLLAASLADVARGLPWQIKLRSSPNPSRGIQALNWSVLVLLVLAAGIRVLSLASGQPEAERAYFPVDAVNFMKESQLSGPIFNRYDWGGYLILHLYPRERVFIDGRSDLYGLTQDVVVHEYLTAYTGGADWRAPLERYGIRLVLVEPDAPLATRLRQEGEWKQMFKDDQSIILVKP